MLVQKKIGNSKKNILIAVLVLCLLVIGYLIYDSFLAEMILPQSAESDSDLTEVTPLGTQNFEANFVVDFLTKAPFTNLVSAGNFSIDINQAGRANPFAVVNYAAQPVVK